MDKKISELIEQYRQGEEGKGLILWHKKPHKKGSGDFACVKGIIDGCGQIVNCSNCYSDKTGSYCLIDGQYNKGFLAVETKHVKLVERGAPGAYLSVKKAMEKQE